MLAPFPFRSVLSTLVAGVVMGALPSDEEPIVLGHRGMHEFAPENTIQAIESALEHGAVGSEIDVHLAGSGEVIVLHDESIDRITTGQGLVREMTLEQIREHPRVADPAGRHPDLRVQTLEEVFAHFEKSVVLLLEIKRPTVTDDPGDGLAGKVGALIDRFDRYDTTYVSSFNAGALQRIRDAYPRVQTILEYHQGPAPGRPRPADLERAGQVVAIGPEVKLLNPELMQWARERELKVSTFSPATIEELERAVELGVDLVTTKKPDLFRRIQAGALTPDGLAAHSPIVHLDFEKSADDRAGEGLAFAGHGCRTVDLWVHSAAMALVPLAPERLTYVQFWMRLEDPSSAEAGDGSDAESAPPAATERSLTPSIIVQERVDPCDEVRDFAAVKVSGLPAGETVGLYRIPARRRTLEEPDARGWRRVRLAFRSHHRARCLQILVGTRDGGARLQLDELSVRQYE